MNWKKTDLKAQQITFPKVWVVSRMQQATELKPNIPGLQARSLRAQGTTANQGPGFGEKKAAWLPLLPGPPLGLVDAAPKGSLAAETPWQTLQSSPKFRRVYCFNEGTDWSAPRLC